VNTSRKNIVHGFESPITVGGEKGMYIVHPKNKGKSMEGVGRLRRNKESFFGLQSKQSLVRILLIPFLIIKRYVYYYII
jgi:hypothetical protein